MQRHVHTLYLVFRDPEGVGCLGVGIVKTGRVLTMTVGGCHASPGRFRNLGFLL